MRLHKNVSEIIRGSVNTKATAFMGDVKNSKNVILISSELTCIAKNFKSRNI